MLDALQGVEQLRPRVWRGYLGDGAAVRVLQIGVGLDRAERAAAEASGAGFYLSAGCAGALVPGLRAGDLVIADRILVLDRAGRAVREVPTDASALAGWSADRGVEVRVGAIASSPVVLATGDGKRDAAGLGAVAVDMESAAVKVVLDEAGDEVGFPGGEVVDPETGEIDVRRGVAALALRPQWWPRAMRLARQQRIAERRLRAYLAVLCSAGLDAFGLAPGAGLSRALVG